MQAADMVAMRIAEALFMPLPPVFSTAAPPQAPKEAEADIAAQQPPGLPRAEEAPREEEALDAAAPSEASLA